MPFPSLRRIDHLVLPARDLEAQAAFYRRMGFQIGARNVHPWGTENRLAQFDGCFLELITLPEAAAPPEPGPRRFSFGRHVGDWLAREGDGLSMLAISSPDAPADARWWGQAGVADVEPFRFGRKGNRPDGSEMEVAFSLAFATPASMPDLCFFACQHHNPENFWNPAFQKHDNGVAGIARVVVVHPEPLQALTFLKAYAGGEPAVSEAGLDLAMANGTLSVWTPDAAQARLGADPALFASGSARFGAIVYDVARLDRVSLILKTNNVPHHTEKTRILVPSGAAFGVLTLFEQPAGQGIGT
jgi:catechol 2,3-dioxygenase-like lactoylglutathione lyase family enzyme